MSLMIGVDPGAKCGIAVVREAPNKVPECLWTATVGIDKLSVALPTLLDSWRLDFTVPFCVETASFHAHRGSSQRSATICARNAGFIHGYLVGAGVDRIEIVTVAQTRKALGLSGNCSKKELHAFLENPSVVCGERGSNEHTRDAIAIALAGHSRIRQREVLDRARE
jgi:Holliday junction resolvasome RuvABC endonuclease subunit